ncbi:MAG: CBS domain-containing protein [Victivallaceae bacterium]
MDKNNQLDLRVVTGCRSNDKGELLKTLSVAAAGMDALRETDLSAEVIEEKLLAREKENSTELEPGIIFPHARLSQLKRMAVILALPDAPQAPKERNINFVCLLLIPEASPMPALKLMSHLANCLRTNESRQVLFRLIADNDLPQLREMLTPDEKKILCARDLMTGCRCRLEPEMPLRDATRQMLEHHVEIAPVLKDGRVIGEVSCSELFKLGIPDFFSQLKSVGFIRYFDPFENYFALEAKSKVADVMTRNVRRFPDDITLIEIVFAMTVEKIPLLYIVDREDRLIGVIDQTVLLERIINL